MSKMCRLLICSQAYSCYFNLHTRVGLQTCVLKLICLRTFRYLNLQTCVGCSFVCRHVFCYVFWSNYVRRGTTAHQDNTFEVCLFKMTGLASLWLDPASIPFSLLKLIHNDKFAASVDIVSAECSLLKFKMIGLKPMWPDPASAPFSLHETYYKW